MKLKVIFEPFATTSHGAPRVRMRDPSALTSTNEQILTKVRELYLELFRHEGYGDLRIEVKIKKAGQKEVILHCGKQYRFFVDFRNLRRPRSDPKAASPRRAPNKDGNEPDEPRDGS